MNVSHCPIHVFWWDYDGAHSEAFGNQNSAEVRVAELRRKEDLNENATRIVAVVQGVSLTMKVTQVVDTVRLYQQS